MKKYLTIVSNEHNKILDTRIEKQLLKEHSIHFKTIMLNSTSEIAETAADNSVVRLFILDFRKTEDEEMITRAIDIIKKQTKEQCLPPAVSFLLSEPSDETVSKCLTFNYKRIVSLFYTQTFNDENHVLEFVPEILENEAKIMNQNAEIRDLETVEMYNTNDKDVSFVTLGYGKMHYFINMVKMSSQSMKSNYITNLFANSDEISNLKSDIQKKLSNPQKKESIWKKLKNKIENSPKITRTNKKPLHLLITGESGTGKTLLAKLLKKLLEIKGELVHINSSGMNENLLENQIFGCTSGSASGIEARIGGAMSALGGILFFDEIGDIPIHLQARLLTFLDNLEIRPDGVEESSPPLPIYIVAATNKNLDEEVIANRFRADLLNRFRLKIHIPPMNERKEDIPALVRFCIADPSVNISLRNSENRITSVTKDFISRIQNENYENSNFRKLERLITDASWKAIQNFSPSLHTCHLEPDNLPENDDTKDSRKINDGVTPKTKKKSAFKNFELQNDEWEKIKEILPDKLKSGPNKTDPRKVLEGVIWKFINNEGWKSIPKRYSSYSTCRKDYMKWVKNGCWEKICKILNILELNEN